MLFADALRAIPEVVAVHRNVGKSGVPEFTVLLNSEKNPDLLERIYAVEIPLSDAWREPGTDDDEVIRFMADVFSGGKTTGIRVGFGVTYVFGEMWFLRQ